MKHRPSAAVVIGAVAVALAMTALGARTWRVANGTRIAAYWFERESYELPSEVVARLGSGLDAVEQQTIERESRLALERAFAGLRIAFSSTSAGLWRVQVVETLRPRRRLLPSAGESYSLGFLGGGGVVSLPNVALNAVKHATPSATRETIVAAIGRGLGNAAAHEFAHQILGVAFTDDGSDQSSYEYWTSDRPAQYFGQLKWARTWPLLESKLGRAAAAGSGQFLAEAKAK